MKKFGIETTNRKCLTKEQQTLSTITNVFKTEKYEDQYKVGEYYLDLYFMDYRIIVECDENGHSDRRPSDEKDRMDYVNKELKVNDSYWVRFNPDEYGFDVSRLIRKIYTIIKEKGVYIVKQKRMTRCSAEFVCTECKETKNISHFYLRGDGDEKDHGKKQFRSKCKKCFNAKSRKSLTELRTNPLIGKKKCHKCVEYSNFDMFFKSNETRDKLSEECKEMFAG